jgi:hypothetical protein
MSRKLSNSSIFFQLISYWPGINHENHADTLSQKNNHENHYVNYLVPFIEHFEVFQVSH